LRDVCAPKIFAKGFAKQSGAVHLPALGGAVGGLPELGINDDLDRFHMWSLPHSILHNAVLAILASMRRWVLAFFLPIVFAQVNVTTGQYDAARTSANLNE